MSFFRTRLASEDLSDLTLPRTFFGRSEIAEVLFRNTDLSESVLCWNDFIEVDFSRACLSRCDLRAAVFNDCTFDGADLREADLRRSDFVDCSFKGAMPQGARFTAEQMEMLELSDSQEASLTISDEGDEPGGG